MRLTVEVKDGIEGFGERIKYVLIKKGMSQAELARRTGMCKEFVTKIIKGDAYPTITNACKIARELNVSLDWLAGLDESEETVA